MLVGENRLFCCVEFVISLSMIRLGVVKMMTVFLWIVTLYEHEGKYKYFWEKCCLHVKGLKEMGLGSKYLLHISEIPTSALKMQTLHFSTSLHGITAHENYIVISRPHMTVQLRPKNRGISILCNALRHYRNLIPLYKHFKLSVIRLPQ